MKGRRDSGSVKAHYSRELGSSSENLHPSGVEKKQFIYMGGAVPPPTHFPLSYTLLTCLSLTLYPLPSLLLFTSLSLTLLLLVASFTLALY
jgi:hypothetical protein